MQSLKSLLKRSLQPRLRQLRRVSPALEEAPFTISDVGSTGGLDARWAPLDGLSQVYAFDPDQRALVGTHPRTHVLPHGLWSVQATLPLYLTRFPPASSVYPPNSSILESFLNARCHEVVAIESIAVQAMETSLAGKIPPHFIKVDAEGADLEILRGARSLLISSCVGVQVEVQFIERNKGAPLFGQTDEFLQDLGFCLLTLQREFWIRRNGCWGPGSQPQLVWADAIYLLSIAAALERARPLAPSERSGLLLRLILAAVIHGAHDYALEAVEAFQAEGLVDASAAGNLKAFIKANVQTAIALVIQRSAHLILALLVLAGSLVWVRHRASAVQFFRASAARLFHSLYLCFARTGEQRGVVADVQS
jgi:FkbM family methyltransferase